MRNFKTALILLCSLFILSCSSDDAAISPIPPVEVIPPVVEPEPEPAPVNQIVGEWRINALLFNGSDLNLNDCERQSLMTFTKEGTVVEKIVEGDCTERAGDFTGTWALTAVEGQYTIRLHEDSANAYFNDVDFSTVIFKGDTMTATSEIAHEGETPYTLQVVLVKVR